MSDNKRRLLREITGEPKKTRHDVIASEQDGEVLEDSGFNDYQDSDIYLCHTGASASCRENSSQDIDIQCMDIDGSDDEQEGNSPSLRNGETDSNRDFCENHLYCTINIGEDHAKQQKKEKKRRKKDGIESREEDSSIQTTDILRKCNALLNSGGGVLEMRIADPQHEGTSKKDPVDQFWQTIEGHLTAMIRPSKYGDIFDRHKLSDNILLFINAPKHICTMKYNLSISGDSGVYDANYDNVVSLLKLESNGHKRNFNSSIQVPLKDLPQIPDTFFYQEIISLMECKQVQLKNFTSDSLFSHRKQRFSIARQLSAFGNCDGGVLLIGVGDNRKVCGVDMKKYSREWVEEQVSSQVQKMCCNFELKRGVHWDLAFSGVSGSESKSVIVVKMAGMQNAGGIFGKCPESYGLQCEDGQQVPHQLDFGKWKERMRSDNAHLTGNTRGMNDMLSRFQQMRVSKGHLLTVKGDVQRIRDAFFKGDYTFPVSPEGVETSLPAEAQAAIHSIQKVCRRDRYRGFLAVSRSWLRDTGGTAIDSIICDVLLVSRNMGGLHLYTLCDAADEMSFQYSKEAAQSIKKRLCENGATGQKFYVSPHVLPCHAGREVNLPSPDDRYPKSYDLLSPREKLNEILKAMVVTLAAVPSILSCKLGVTFFNLLTTEQFRLVHQQIEVNRELWIKGVAGTGKTLVALEFMRELRRREKLQKDEILYVCENEGIASQVRKTGLCNTICRATFISDEFPQTKHVILDEVHNFEQPSGTISWYEKAKDLVRQHDPNRPGYLWCFIDLCQKSHSFPSGIPEETRQRPHLRLRKVIRNSKKIFKHAKKYLVDDDSKDKVEIGHDFDGDDVEIIRYLENQTTELDVLQDTLRRLLDKGYSERDISVLFLKKDSIPPDDMLSEKLNGLSWKSAKDNDSEKIVISSVLKYSGLERPVVILVNVHRGLFGRNAYSFKYGAVTRAMVKLIIIQCREG